MTNKIQTQILWPIVISKYVINKLSNVFDVNMDNALRIAMAILQSNCLECLRIPKDIVVSMVFNNDNPDALEFWFHSDSSTIFLVQPKENYKLVEMVIQQDFCGIVFDNWLSQ